MQKYVNFKKIDKFWAIYATVVIICLFAVFIWLGQLHKMMASYEASMPQHVVQDVADSLSRGEYQALYRMLDQQMQGETEAQFGNYLSAQIMDQPISFAQARAASADETAYMLSADDKPFARLTLMPSGKTDAYGNPSWAIKSFALPNAPTNRYQITAPDIYTIFADDVPLGEEAITEKGIPMDCDGHIPASKVHVPTYTKYSVTRSFEQPQFRAADAKGNAIELVAVSEGEYKAELQYDDAVRKSQEKRVVEIAKAYGLFTIGRMSKAKFLSNVLTGTSAYQMIEEYDERWFIRNSGYKFKNVQAGKFFPYSKNCYSCEVSYDMVLKAANGKTETYPTTVTLYMYKTDKFKIYDMVIGQ